MATVLNIKDPKHPFPHVVVGCRNCNEPIRVKTEFDTRGTVIRSKKDAKWSYFGGLCCSKSCEEKTRIDELEAQIEEDKLLLTTEREQIEEAYKQGVYLAMTPSVTHTDYYQNTYGNGE